MRLASILAGSLSITIATVALAAGLTLPVPATAAVAAAPVVPNDTQEWGNDKIRASATVPATSSVGPSGSTIQSPSSSAPASGTVLSVDYCVQLTLVDGSSGPYRLRFHVDGLGGTSSSSGNVTLSFNLATAADTQVTTTGNAALSGSIFDANAHLVAGDTTAGRIAASLPAGTYSLLLLGPSQLTGAFTVMHDQGTCN
jgi:hypothetical protein